MSATTWAPTLEDRVAALENQLQDLSVPDSLAANFSLIDRTGVVTPPVFPNSEPGGVLTATRNRASTYAAPTLRDIPSLKDYGAYCDLSHDDTTAANLAAAEIGQGHILVPFPGALINGQLNLDGMRSLKWWGESGMSGGAFTGSALVFGRSDNGSCISARGTSGVEFHNLMLYNFQTPFAGDLVDFRGSVGGADTSYPLLDRCGLYTGPNAASLLDLAKATEGQFFGCNMRGSLSGVRGLAVAGDYSNGHLFSGCTLGDQVLEGVVNPGNAWTFIGCVFENLAGGGGLALATATGGLFCFGLTVVGCWFGDAGLGGGWFQLQGGGWTIAGNYIGGSACGILLPLGITGAVIVGNKFEQCTVGVTFAGGGGGGSDVVILANDMTTCTTPITFNLPPGPKNSLIQNPYLTGQLGMLATSFLWPVAGAVSDASFPAACTPSDGTMAIDTTHHSLYVRMGGVWRSVPLT